MRSCLLVEHDPAVAEQLTAYLSQTTLFLPPIVCSTAMEALRVLTRSHVDLVVLDLNLPDVAGIELLENLVNAPSVIVLADQAESAAACYDLDVVVDFLLKPVPYLRFLRAIQRALLQQVSQGAVAADNSLAIDEKECRFFRSGRQLKRVILDDILYAEGYGTYIKIHTTQGTVILNQRLKILETELPEDRFVRVHKSFIINVRHLEHLESSQLQISMKKFPIGIKYRPAVHQFMQQAGILMNNN